MMSFPALKSRSPTDPVPRRRRGSGVLSGLDPHPRRRLLAASQRSAITVPAARAGSGCIISDASSAAMKAAAASAPRERWKKKCLVMTALSQNVPNIRLN